MCDPGDLVCGAAEKVKEAVAGSIEDSLNKLGTAFEQSANESTRGMLTWWMSDGLNPQLAGGAPGAVLINLQQMMVPLIVLAAFVGVVVAASRMAMSRRAEPLKQLLLMMATVMVVTSLTALVVQVCLDFGNDFARFALATADSKPKLGGQIGTRAIEVNVVLISSSSLVMLANIVQVAFMLLRSAIIPLLVVVLPFAAAISYSEAGQVWLKKIFGWLVAFVLYKPMAAVVYAVGLTLAEGPIEGASAGEVWKALLATVSGMLIVMLSVLLLPALLKLVAPVAATGSSSMFSAAGAALAVGGLAAGGVGLAGATGGAAAAGGGAAVAGRGVSATNVTSGAIASGAATGGTVPTGAAPTPAPAPGGGSGSPAAPAKPGAVAALPAAPGRDGGGSGGSGSPSPAPTSGGTAATVSTGNAPAAAGGTERVSSGNAAPLAPADGPSRSTGQTPGVVAPPPAVAPGPRGALLSRAESGLNTARDVVRGANETLEGSHE